MTFGEQMKKKADEVGLDAKAKDFGNAIAELAKTAVGLATSAAKENQDKIEGAIDKAATTIDEKTGGKHSETIAKVKGQATTGFEKLVEQGDKVGHPNAEAGTVAGGTLPGQGLPDGTNVPDDTHSAWDEVTDHTTDESAPGSPS